MRVEAYWNLHENCISYRPTTKGGKVSHAQSIRLADVKFAVQPAGREKVLREKRKNVHAFVRGEVVSADSMSRPELLNMLSSEGWVTVTYNPYKYDSFVVADTEDSVSAAREVIIYDKRIYAQI